MSDINIKGTLNTPTISFNEKSAHFVIEGRSTIENPAAFYKPLITRIKDYSNAPVSKIEIDFKLEYFNTTSSLVILDVLENLHSLHTPTNQVVINWHYDEVDEDLREIGEDYSEILKFPFNLVAIPN